MPFLLLGVLARLQTLLVVFEFISYGVGVQLIPSEPPKVRDLLVLIRIILIVKNNKVITTT
jgi:hypothetical protein